MMVNGIDFWAGIKTFYRREEIGKARKSGTLFV
jgi:hypothetical protein